MVVPSSSEEDRLHFFLLFSGLEDFRFDPLFTVLDILNTQTGIRTFTNTHINMHTYTHTTDGAGHDQLPHTCSPRIDGHSSHPAAPTHARARVRTCQTFSPNNVTCPFLVHPTPLASEVETQKTKQVLERKTSTHTFAMHFRHPRDVVE